MQGRETTEDKERAGRLPPSASVLTSTGLVSISTSKGPPTMDLGRGPSSPLPAMG